MIFIDEEDSPELLKGRVNGKAGFILLPQGEDGDELCFESADAFRLWAERVERLAAYPQDAQPREEWLEMYGSGDNSEEETR